MIASESVYALYSSHPPGCWSDFQFNGTGYGQLKKRTEKIRVGLLVPFSGSDAIWGPSCQYSAVLAAARLNAKGGILGREIDLFAADAGGTPDLVLPRVAELVEDHNVDALVGVHLSNVRDAIRDEFANRVPYIFAPQYEGGEHSQGVVTIGETPNQQYAGAVRWMIDRLGARRWFLLGNDYVWPRKTHKTLKQLIHSEGAEIAGEAYLPLGTFDHADTLRQIKLASPDIIVVSLVGSDCVTFNQDFSAAGLTKNIIRLSGAIEENTLMGISAEHSGNLYCVSGYFSSLMTVENQAFLDEYRKAFGALAPIQGSLSQACYESLFALAALAHKADSIRCREIMRSCENFTYEGARGHVRVCQSGTYMDSYLMRSTGLEYELIESFPAN